MANNDITMNVKLNISRQDREALAVLKMLFSRPPEPMTTAASVVTMFLDGKKIADMFPPRETTDPRSVWWSHGHTDEDKA